MKVYGRNWTRREIEARVGRIEQIGGIKRFKLMDGKEKGVEQVQVRSGGGLTVNVTPTKGFDLSLAEYGGVPLSWQSPNGDCHPSYYDPVGDGWLRTASGGLLMTCGLTQVGTPSSCENRGLHGRIHHTPARHVVTEGFWQGNEYIMVLKGEVEETGLFEPTIRLRRELRFRMGENKFYIKDEVENCGFEPSPHMILYHFNFGFPLMSEQTVVLIPSGKQTSRDEGVPARQFDRWENPRPNMSEKVFYHRELDPLKDRDNWSEVSIINPTFPCFGNKTVPLRVNVKWCTDTLPNLVQWKMPGEGMHVLGIEPSNCLVEGRQAEKENGTLQYIEPGQKVVHQLEFEVIEHVRD